MIYEAPRRKSTPEPAAVSEQKAVHWPTLKAVKGPFKGKEFKMTKEIMTIGRGSQNDIPVEGWFVSSSQARIRRQGERFYISHHGGFFSSTKVNGSSLKEDHILKNKDEIAVGNSTFVFTQAAETHG